MKVVISGASGLIGKATARFLGQQGHEVVRLVRRPAGPGEVFWDPPQRILDLAGLKGAKAVVHMAGENIAASRWTEDEKERIQTSRVSATMLLAEGLARLSHPPHTLISASAVGYYGHRGDAIVDESSSPGENFLAEVCCDWEAATRPAAAAGVRVVNLRLGVVLSRAGGTLARLWPLYRWGLGGVLGSGRQYMSWITVADLTRVIGHLLTDETLAGPVNAVAPQPVTNRDFTKTLGRVLFRPTLCHVPACMLRMMLGEMADELLLASTRAVPERLEKAGFAFNDPELEPALRRFVRNLD